MSFLDAVHRAASAYDSSPVSVSSMGKKAWGAFLDRRERRAASDPIWSDIDSRRHRSETGATFLSEDLTLADWHTQEKIAEAITPVHPLERLALAAQNMSLSHAIGVAEEFIQRGRRGWSTSDTYDIGQISAQRLGEQLLFQSEHAHGWPGTEEFPGYQDWTAAMRHHGKILATLGGQDAKDAALDAWHELATDAEADEVDIEAAHQEMRAIDTHAEELVTESLHWVASHWKQLWD